MKIKHFKTLFDICVALLGIVIVLTVGLLIA